MPERIIRYWPRAWVGDGGITNSVRRISRELREDGIDIRIAITDLERPGETAGDAWLPVSHAGRDPFLRPVGLEEHLRATDLLVLHSAWTYHNVCAAALARKLGVPYLLEPRGAYDPSIRRRRRALKKAWWWSLEQKLVSNAAAVHVFFQSQLAHLRAIGYGGPTVVVPNGVSIPEAAAWDGGSGGYVLWIGRFDPEHKGLDLLLQAMAMLSPAERPELRLHGPDWAGGKKKVIRLVRDLRLGGSVVVGEPVYGERKWRLISEAAAFVYPSRWEGFGNSTAEAVSAGVPTLVTPYPLGQWLASQSAAVMAEATPAALARGLRQVLANGPGILDGAHMAAVRHELSWKAVARSWLRQVRDVL